MGTATGVSPKTSFSRLRRSYIKARKERLHNHRKRQQLLRKQAAAGGDAQSVEVKGDGRSAPRAKKPAKRVRSGNTIQMKETDETSGQDKRSRAEGTAATE